MATKAVLSEAEYLRTSFPGLDQEFLDGDLVERSSPERSHSRAQLKIAVCIKAHERVHHLYAYPELRLHVRSGRFMIPDVCIFWPEQPAEEVPNTCPLVAIEILSKDDSLREVEEKLKEYKAWGVAHPWAVDPRLKKLYELRDGLIEVKTFRIPEVGLDILPEDIFD